MNELEYPLLEEFLYDVIFQPEGREPVPREVIHQPELAVYIPDFGKTDDLCLVAELEGTVKKEFRKQGIGYQITSLTEQSEKQTPYYKPGRITES